MDCQDYTICWSERQRGQHIGLDDRGGIQRLHKLGYSNRAIARELHCSPTTIGNELRRGTPEHKTGRRGRPPSYSARRAQAAYEANRTRSHKPHRITYCTDFIRFVVKQVRGHRWSLDACVGYARLHKLFREDEMVCTKTLYNEMSTGRLPLSLFELPELLGRKHRKENRRVNKRPKGRSIDERPGVVDKRSELGHWEADTVVGRRAGKESVVLTLLERVTDNYIAIRISGKTSDAVMDAMNLLRVDYGDEFSKVFKSITTDNGSEFEDFSMVE